MFVFGVCGANALKVQICSKTSVQTHCRQTFFSITTGRSSDIKRFLST